MHEGAFIESLTKTLPEMALKTGIQDHPSLHLSSEHSVNSASQKLSEEFKICCSRIKKKNYET